jgi:uncharacterized protein (TIGR00369 family)
MPDSQIDSVEEIRQHATDGLAAALGIEILELTPQRVVATMPVDERTRQPYGLLHGGASVALAETCASLASVMNIDQKKFRAVGLEINANHVRAKTEGNGPRHCHADSHRAVYPGLEHRHRRRKRKTRLRVPMHCRHRALAINSAP